MKAIDIPSSFRAATLAASLCALPTLSLAGPDDAPATRRVAPLPVTVQQTTATVTARGVDDDTPIQPLRQREESTHFRIAYKLLNNVGLTGTEGDRRAIGYQQIYGPPPMLIYQRPPAPTPRRFPHFLAESEDRPGAKTPVVEEKPAPTPDAAPGASPAPAVATNAAQRTPDGAEPGILPDAAQQASARTRNSEILSYFQRPGPNRRPPGGPDSGPGNGEAGEEPGYLQGPDAPAALPPSRATYHVVPK